MKALVAVVLATLATATVAAVPPDQCVKEHYARQKQYPDIPYEKDQNIMRIWCTCMYKQESQGHTTIRALEVCTDSTNADINRYLRTR